MAAQLAAPDLVPRPERAPPPADDAAPGADAAPGGDFAHARGGAWTTGGGSSPFRAGGLAACGCAPLGQRATCGCSRVPAGAGPSVGRAQMSGAMAQAIDGHGAGAGRCRCNLPSQDDRQATTLYQTFNGFAPTRMPTVRHSRLMPPVVVQLGELRGLIYRSDKHKPNRPSTYIHFMETPAILASNPEGTQLYIVGGDYRVTSRGIEG